MTRMAWWALFLLGWVILAILLALWLGRAARHIKRLERRQGEHRSPDEQFRHGRAG
jgi:hypothetical protein